MRPRFGHPSDAPLKESRDSPARVPAVSPLAIRNVGKDAIVLSSLCAVLSGDVAEGGVSDKGASLWIAHFGWDWETCSGDFDI